MSIYAIHPGYVISATDGQRHWVGFDKLVKLYRVNRQSCIRWDDTDPTSFLGRNEKLFTHLYPRNDGNYNLEARDERTR